MLLFMDGMAHYGTTDLAKKYTAVDPTAVTWTIAAEGRFGNCVKRASIANNIQDVGGLSIAPLTTRLGAWVPTSSGVCGFAIKVDDLSRVATTIVAGQQRGLVEIWEGALFHVLLALNPDGTFSLIRNQTGSGGSTVVLAQSSEGLSSGTWLFVECKWLISATVGTFEVRVNGTVVLTYTGNTRENNVGNTLSVWNAVRLLRVPSHTPPYLTLRLCDFYLADLASATAADVSDFLGDGVISTILPNNVGASTGWTGSAAPSWDMVNDSPTADGDGTYVAATTAGLKDTYQFQDLPPGTLVKGAQVCILARKETEGAAAIAPIVHQGSTDYLGPTQGVANIAYDRYVTQTWDLNPATSAKFTAAEINAGEFGVQKVI